jgi:transposase
MTEMSAMAIKVHKLMTNVLHNDTTSLTLRGAYDNSTTTDGIKPARGYNKDGHPDCKQIVFGLNVTGDSHVPISYMAHNGNTSDSDTHIPNWDKLRELLRKDDFIYVTDSKGADMENLAHIAGNEGKFISVLPATRLEVKEFRNRLIRSKEIAWEEGMRIENSRKKGEFTNYHTFETKSREDYRIVWVHSVSYARLDAKLRQKKIDAACQKLQTIANKLNRYQLKTREKIQQVIEKAIEEVKDYVAIQLTEHTTTVKKQIGRGKAGPDTKFVDISQTNYFLNWQRNTSAIKEAACTDGVFPLISNCSLPAKEVLQTYKQQSYLEKRHSTLKTVEQVCPIYLKKPQRIIAQLFLYFVALMIISLIERNIRNQMSNANALVSNSSEPVVSASNKIVLPDDEVLPPLTETVSLKKPDVSAEQTTVLTIDTTALTEASISVASALSNQIVSDDEILPSLTENQTISLKKPDVSAEQTTVLTIDTTALTEPSISVASASSNRIVSDDEIFSSLTENQTISLKKPDVSAEQTTVLTIDTTSKTVLTESLTKNQIPANEPKSVLLEPAIQLPEYNQNVIHFSDRVALPILPQGMKTDKPTWANIKYFFRNVYQEVITSGEAVLKTILKGMTLLHFQILELLGVPSSAYDNLEGPWWRFQNG